MNKVNSAIRSGIEKWFGDWKVRRGYRRCRHVGLMRMNQFHLTLLTMAHNLRRIVVLSTE